MLIVAEELVELFSVSFCKMILFSVIGNYCYDKFSLFVLILRLTVFLTKIRSLPFSYAKFSVFLVTIFVEI